MAFELTRQQRAAVENRGGNLLVSAAAGSGKTRVLVERLMGYVEQGADIDRFLVITFTNAAAAELRDRIASAIHDRMAARPEDRHLRRNAALVYQAPICTIDAFCMDFLRQWGHLADLDPDFRLCDEAEAGELREQAMEEVLERRYADLEQDSAFAALVDALAGDRDDQTLEDVILDMHRRVQAQADPRHWLLSRKKDFDLPSEALPHATVWGQLLLQDGSETAAYWRETLARVRGEITTDPLLEQNYGPSLDGTLAAMERLQGALERGWDEAAACFPIPFPRVGTRRGECDTALKEWAKDQRERCKKQMTRLGERFSVTAREAMDDLRAVSPAMEALLEVTAEFDEVFCRLKHRRRLVDFADCEHLAARLLADESGSPTELARDLSRRYVEIMVDEYQDTNAVQNLLFNALSNGNNLFMVGDVKQSIYRFRLADPTIFLAKYAAFAPWEEAAEGEDRKVLLSENFRSRPEVLDSANFVFRNTMTAGAVELDYTEAEELKAGREDLQPDPRYRTELCCVDLSSLTEDDDEGKTPKDLVEARAVARRIRRMVDGELTIGDRALRPEDVVILLRSPGPVLRHYKAALDEVNLPWTADDGREFFGTTEISVAISLLQVVDNPVQDVPLLAVLRSPLLNFTPDRLAQLRGGCRGSVYAALTAAARRGEEDCVRVMELLEELRDLAAEESSHRLLWYVYDRTDLPAVFSAMADGQRRRANLMALYDEACRFESGGHRGLMAFLLHLSRMAENGVPVPVPEGEGGGVRLMSIHKSKGLQFPVVFLCGLERQFNESDARATILFHPELGLGPMHTDRSRMLRYTTIARDAVDLRLRRQLRAEEMRLLYVAMTRAEHKLVMFTTVNGPLNSLKSMAAQAACPLSPYQTVSARSMCDWVLLPALCRRDSEVLWEGLDGERPVLTAFPGMDWDIRLLPASDYEKASRPGRTPDQEQAPARLPFSMEEGLRWSYPYTAAADIPSKLTATQLKGREKDREAAEEGVELNPSAPRIALRRPVFEGERPLTPAQKGTALHIAMQYLDYGKTDTVQQVEEELARLTAGRYITPQQGAAVDPADILAFFHSDLGLRLKNANQVEREYKFSLLVPAKDYYPEGGADEVLLQGVVDCWFREEDGSITVIDFKTDRVTAAAVHARAEEYRPQLDVYTRAMTAVEGQCTVHRVLWFFSIGEGVEM